MSEQAKHLTGLRAFASEMIQAALDGGDMDGTSIQEAAVKHGLLAAQQMPAPCCGPEDGYCRCAYTTEFPAECFRPTTAMNEAAHADDACVSDGGTCGLGGVCRECPHAQPAEKAQEGQQAECQADGVVVPRALLRVACMGGNEAWQALEELRALLAHPPAPAADHIPDSTKMVDAELVELLREVRTTYQQAIHWEDLQQVMQRIGAKLVSLR